MSLISPETGVVRSHDAALWLNLKAKARPIRVHPSRVGPGFKIAPRVHGIDGVVVPSFDVPF
jgi:hypothetical protein